MRAILRNLVPQSWSGEQALLAARLLRAALDAVWDVHGEDMAFSLGQTPFDEWSEAMPPDDPFEIDDEDIPF